MTDRLSPEHEVQLRRWALWDDPSALQQALRDVLDELDAVRAELKEERRVSQLLNVQNAELMKGVGQ